MRFQPSALSNPDSAVVIRSVPSDIDPRQVAYTAPDPFASSEKAAVAAGGITGLVTSVSSLFKKPEPAPYVPGVEPVIEEQSVWTPWIVGGVAVFGVVGAVWAFWPREK